MNIFDKRIVEKSMKGLTPMGSDQAFPETEDNGSLNLNNIDFESEEVPVVSQAIDFESEEPIDFSSITGREPPGIYMPKEQSLWDKFRSLITDPGMDKGKAANIVSLSEEFGISPSRAEEYYDQLGDLIFSGTYPTSRDVASGLMGAAVTTGIIFNPVATAIGVGTFMGLDELENYIISKVREDPYHFQGGQGLSDLFEAHGLSKDVIDLLDFMWKVPVAGGTTKFGRGMFGAITSRIKGSSNKAKFVNKVAEDIKTEGILPDEAALKNAEEFGVDKDQLLDAQKDKDAKVEPEVGDVENPLEVTRPTDAVPTYTFTSQKGHHYEKIGEKWYNSKGREVTNQYVIKAAEKKKVAFGEDEAVEERVVKDIEEKTGKRIEEVTEEEIDKYYTEKEGVEEAEPVRSTIKQSLTPEELEATELFYDRRIKELTDEEVELFLEDYRTRAPATEGGFLQDEAMMEAEKAKFADPGRKKSIESDPELLTGKLINDVNRWYKGDDSIDIDVVRKTLDMMRDRAEDIKLEYFDPPDDIWLSWKERVTKAADWARGLDRLKIEPSLDMRDKHSRYRAIEAMVGTSGGSTPIPVLNSFRKLFTKDEFETLFKYFQEKGAQDVFDGRATVESVAKDTGIGNLVDYKKKEIKSTGGTKLYSGIPLDEIMKLTRDFRRMFADFVDSLTHDERRRLLSDIQNKWMISKDNNIKLNARLGLDIAHDALKEADRQPGKYSEEFVKFNKDMFRRRWGDVIGIKREIGTKLYSGIPLDEAIASIVKSGKDIKEKFKKLYENMVDETDMLGATFWDDKYKGDRKNILNLYNSMRPKFDKLRDEMTKLGLQYPPEGAKTPKLDTSIYETKPIVETIRKGGKKLYSGIPLDEASKKIFDKVKRVLKPTSKPSEPFIKSIVKEIVLGRRANLSLANYETNRFINSVEQKLNYTQREAVPFVIEGTEVPKELNRPDLQKVINKHGDLLKGVAEEVKQHFNEGWQKIKKHIPDLSVKQIEDYVTHLWEVPKHKRAEAVSWFQTQNRFLEKRFIDTYKEGIEKGFRPKVLDISEIIRIHDAVSNRAIENTKYINSLLRLRDQGMYLIQRTGTAPMEWIEVDYPALTRRIPLPKKQAGKKGEFVKELKVRVHPDLVRPLKAIFEQRFDHPIISAYEALNGILKKSMLTVSLFHHGALGETGVALIGPGKTAKIMFDPVKIYKALVKGEYDTFSKETIARDSIEHGVQYGATADIPVGKIQGYLNDLAKATENKVMVGKLMKFLKNSNSLWDKALWNYLHDTLKLYGYETLVSRLNPNMGPEATKMAKREIGQLINDTFGGQNWDTLMMTPKEVQMMTWSLLSADWTLSTTRQALSPTGIGAVYKETANIRKKMGAMFWARAAIYFGVGINALNTLFRSHDMKENPQYYKGRDYTWIDKTMFGNSVGRKTRLFVGRYKDGSERYLKWGKQFSDFFELLTSPLEKIGSKAAPVPGLISEIGDIEKHGRKNIDIALDVGKKLIEAPIPFALRRMMRDKVEFKPSDVFMPSSKGMTRYRAIEYFKLALIDKDYDRVREVYENCLRNNLAPSQLLQGASSWIEHEIMAEVAKDVEDIKDTEMKLHMSSSAYDKRRYGIILRRLHKEKADKEAGLKHMESAIEKIKVLNSLGKDRAPKLHGR